MAIHQPSGSSAQPSPWVRRERRQEHGLAAYFPSYLFSQWEICSRSTDSFSISIAFSTGITCIPIPAPPSGTNGVIFSSGRRDICSKKVPISGLESRMFAFMLKNSAHPGTYIGNTYCFSCFGFSQLYSRRPFLDISSSSASHFFSSRPESFTISASVFGFLTPSFTASSASSSVSTPASPQYSGSFLVIFFNPSFCGIRSVIFLPSFAIGSRNGSFGSGVNSG